MLRHKLLPVILPILMIGIVQGIAQGTAQEMPAAPPPDHRSIHLDVTVTSPKGESVPGLTQQDFTLLEDKLPVTPLSFRAVRRGEGQAEIIFLIDAVNSRFTTVAYEESQLQKFLRSAGKLDHPATIAVLTDKGVSIQKTLTTDSMALSRMLDGYSPGLRTIGRSEGYWGATEKLEISLNATDQLLAYASTLPGRKVIVWISPGWPLLSGPRIDLDKKQEAQLFARIVSTSTRMRESRITLDNINPVGVEEDLGRADYYLDFVKGVSRPQDAQYGNLGLQVFAVQSGGVAVESNNDLLDSLRRCVAESESWYEFNIPESPAEQPNEYHPIEVRLAKPDKQGQLNLHARSRLGYYAHPEAEPGSKLTFSPPR